MSYGSNIKNNVKRSLKSRVISKVNTGKWNAGCEDEAMFGVGCRQPVIGDHFQNRERKQNGGM